jgi:DNA-binding response OmpR family regulator
MQRGAFDYCLKPIDIMELLEKVELAARKALINKEEG